MQSLLVTMSVFIFITAMFIQAVWMFIGKTGRDRYLRDMGNFRRPSSAWSRYYHWRVDSVRNAAIDGLIFDVILLIVLFNLLLMTLELYQIPDTLIYVVFVMILSVASTIQAVNRIKGSKEREVTIIKRVGEAKDKIAAAREIALFLLSAGPAADGRMWFALYRVGQIQNPVGWAVRDVLLDPDLKNYQESGVLSPPQEPDLLGKDEQTDSEGPRIN